MILTIYILDNMLYFVRIHNNTNLMPKWEKEMPKMA